MRNMTRRLTVGLVWAVLMMAGMVGLASLAAADGMLALMFMTLLAIVAAVITAGIASFVGRARDGPGDLHQ